MHRKKYYESFNRCSFTEENKKTHRITFITSQVFFFIGFEVGDFFSELAARPVLVGTRSSGIHNNKKYSSMKEHSINFLL